MALSEDTNVINIKIMDVFIHIQNQNYEGFGYLALRPASFEIGF